MNSAKVANQVRTLREVEPKQTQQALADALGVSRQTIIAIENGRYSPSLDLALRIAQYFERPVEEVFWLQEAAKT